MAKIYDKDGVVFLEGNMIDLKIDASRKIYVKRKEQSIHNFIGHTCPEHLRIDEKKQYLAKLNMLYEAKLREE